MVLTLIMKRMTDLQSLHCLSRAVSCVRFKCAVTYVHCQYVHKGAIHKTLHCLHNKLNGVPNNQPHDCLLNRLLRRRSKKTSKLRVTGLSAWNSPVTGEFPAQGTSNAEHVSIWWRHHDTKRFDIAFFPDVRICHATPESTSSFPVVYKLVFVYLQ